MKTVIVLVAVLWAGTGWAEEPRLYLYGALGSASGSLNNKPGLWRHEGTPYTTDLTDMAFKAGVGYQSASGLFLEAGMVDPGTMGIQSRFVSDRNYDPVAMRCRADCDKQHHLDLRNDYRGGELVIGYKRTLFDFFRPYGKAGLAGFSHQHSGTFTSYHTRQPIAFSHDGNDLGQNFNGLLIAVAMGGGLCAPMARLELCGDVTHYEPVAHTANPLIDSFTVATATLLVPLTGW